MPTVCGLRPTAAGSSWGRASGRPLDWARPVRDPAVEGQDEAGLGAVEELRVEAFEADVSQ